LKYVCLPLFIQIFKEVANVLLKSQKKKQESVSRMIKETFCYTRNNEQSSDRTSVQRTEVYKSKNGK